MSVNMNKAINVLEERIKDLLTGMSNYVNTPRENQSSLHFEHIAEYKQDIDELRNAIVVLKMFSLKDLNINDIISKMLKDTNLNISITSKT